MLLNISKITVSKQSTVSTFYIEHIQYNIFYIPFDDVPLFAKVSV